MTEQQTRIARTRNEMMRRRQAVIDAQSFHSSDRAYIVTSRPTLSSVSVDQHCQGQRGERGHADGPSRRCWSARVSELATAQATHAGVHDECDDAGQRQ